MSRFWFLLLTFGVVAVSGNYPTGKYKVRLTSRVGFENINSELHCTPTPGIWLLKKYRAGYYMLQDVLTKGVLTRISDGLNATVAILPRSKKQEDNQKWIITEDDRLLSYKRPKVYVEFFQHGPLHLAPVAKDFGQRFLFELVKYVEIMGEDLDDIEAREKVLPLTTNDVEATYTYFSDSRTRARLARVLPGKYHIIEPETGTFLKKVGEKVRLSKTPSIWNVKKHQYYGYIIQDAQTGEVLTRIVKNRFPEIFLRPNYNHLNSKSQRWVIRPEGRISTLDVWQWTVEFSKDGSVHLSGSPKANHQRFQFKKLEDYSKVTMKPTSAMTTKRITKRPKTTKPEDDPCDYL